jgi:hypothetical protein
LDLPETKAQLLGSWHVLEKGVNVLFYREGPSNIAKYFSMDGDLVYWNDVYGLMEELRLHHHPERWRIFIDSSKVSLKAVLLHTGYNRPAVPLEHAVHTKETCTNSYGLLKKYATKTTGVLT